MGGKHRKDKCKATNSELIMKGLDSSILDDNNQPTKEAKGEKVRADEICVGCKRLLPIVKRMRQDLKRQGEKNKNRLRALDVQMSALSVESDAIIQSQIELCEHLEKMRNANLRMIIEYARERAAEKLGKVVLKGESWSVFFSTHATATKALGISDLLFSFLAEGEKLYEKIFYEVGVCAFADIVCSIKENTLERRKFEEAFKFAFDEDASDFVFGR